MQAEPRIRRALISLVGNRTPITTGPISFISRDQNSWLFGTGDVLLRITVDEPPPEIREIERVYEVDKERVVKVYEPLGLLGIARGFLYGNMILILLSCITFFGLSMIGYDFNHLWGILPW